MAETSSMNESLIFRVRTLACAALPIVALAAAVWLLMGRGVAESRADGAEDEAMREAKVMFVKTIKPILEERCVGCHGDERAKAGLNMTTRERLLEGGRSGPVIDLEQPEKSLLLVAIGYKDEDLQMPPRKPLEEAQIEVLSRWVKAGVPWADGTVLTPPQRRP